MTHSAEYERYMKSPEWYEKRQLLLVMADCRCERCGYRQDLEVHHLTYERLGNELPDDLQVLCVECHEEADEERRRATSKRAWDRRVEAYGAARYGDDWTEWATDSDYAEIEDILDRRG